jgi:polysaccharide deacetylase 2 family uncharacterized protein YibQ
VEEHHAMMDRRRFLYQTATYILGSILGPYGVSTALACDVLRNKPHVALIIDDIGFSRSRTQIFLNVDIPLTFSILPRLKNSSRLAEKIHRYGHDIMLHQPMEPHNPKIDPGPGALFVGDENDRIIQVLEDNISNIPFAIGVNNHMGSRFTASQKDMYNTLMVIKSQSLFFIDSLTTPHSKAYQTAKSLHMATANRNIFIDIVREESAILHQIGKLQNHALRHGHAIGIGHPYPETAHALKTSLPGFQNSGISLVPISNLLPA